MFYSFINNFTHAKNDSGIDYLYFRGVIKTELIIRILIHKKSICLYNLRYGIINTLSFQL